MVTIAEHGLIADATVGGLRTTTTAIPIPEKVLQEMADFFYATKRWHDDIEIVHLKVRRWRQDIRSAQNADQAVPQAGATVPANGTRHQWLAAAVAARQNGESWRQIGRTVHQPEATVRRLVSRELAGAAP